MRFLFLYAWALVIFTGSMLAGIGIGYLLQRRRDKRVQRVLDRVRFLDPPTPIRSSKVSDGGNTWRP